MVYEYYFFTLIYKWVFEIKKHKRKWIVGTEFFYFLGTNWLFFRSKDSNSNLMEIGKN
jgi:hypothetical protein